MSKNTIGVTVKKSEDFSEWYTQAISKAEFADYTDVSGCIVFRPGVYQIWEKIVKLIDEKIQKRRYTKFIFPIVNT